MPAISHVKRTWVATKTQKLKILTKKISAILCSCLPVTAMAVHVGPATWGPRGGPYGDSYDGIGRQICGDFFYV